MNKEQNENIYKQTKNKSNQPKAGLIPAFLLSKIVISFVSHHSNIKYMLDETDFF